MDELTPEEEARKKAERDKTISDQMEAGGYNPDNPAEREKFEELLSKLTAKRITQQDLHRGMEARRFEEDDKKRREDAKQQLGERQQSQAQDERTPNWKELATNPELAQKRQEQRDKENAAQREHEGLQHEQTGGRERGY